MKIKELSSFTKVYIQVSTWINVEEIYFQNKLIIVKVHAIKRAREKGIAYPDHVYQVLKTGKVERYGKNNINFIRRSEKGSIICVGEDIGYAIIIKTIERGN